MLSFRKALRFLAKALLFSFSCLTIGIEDTFNAAQAAAVGHKALIQSIVPNGPHEKYYKLFTHKCILNPTCAPVSV